MEKSERERMLGFIPTESADEEERGTLDIFLTPEQSQSMFGEDDAELDQDTRFRIFENVAAQLGYSTQSLVEAIRKDGAANWSTVRSAAAGEIARVKEETRAREEANAAFERGRGAL